MNPPAPLLRDLTALALLCAVVVGYGIGDYGVVVQDEAFYHAVAEQMAESGDWLRVDFRGEHRPYDTFMNAPLQYWLRASLIEAFGSSYWTMRGPSAVFAAACVLLTFWMASQLGDRLAGWMAALTLLTTYQFVYLHSARAGVLEPIIAFFFALTAWLFARGVDGRGGFVAHHLCIAAIANLKLPVAVVPVAAELAYWALARGERRLFFRWLASGAALAPLAVSWHLYQALWAGEPLLRVLDTMGRQGAGAGAGVTAAAARRAANLWFYAKTAFYGTFPHALLLPAALVAMLRERGPARRTWTVFALFAAGVFAFFALVSKRYPWYVIPAYPLLCAFGGAWLADRLRGRGVPAWGVAAAVAALLWVDVGLLRNPFDRFGWPLDRTAHLFDHAGVPGWIGLPLAFGALFAAARAAGVGRAPQRAALALAIAVVGYAGVRVALPLRDTGYVSPAEGVRRALDAAARSGVTVRHPVVVPIGAAIGFEARYYFGRDYRIVQRRDAAGRLDGYELYPRVAPHTSSAAPSGTAQPGDPIHSPAP